MDQFPPPLIPCEEGSGSFTFKSVFERLSRILDSVLRNHEVPLEVCDRYKELTINKRNGTNENETRILFEPKCAESIEKQMENADSNCRLESKVVAAFLQLKRDILTDTELTIADLKDDESADENEAANKWEEYLRTYQWKDSLRWSTAPWFVSENYIYFRIMNIARLSQMSAFAKDPFHIQKQQALDNAQGAYEDMIETIESTGESKLIRLLLLRSLWGNRADLSLSAGEASEASHKGASSLESTLLANDTTEAVEYIRAKQNKPEPRIAIMLDNCGLELLSDIILSDFLLQKDFSVSLHCKKSPTFVSDATETDISKHLEWIENVPKKGNEVASRIRSMQASKKLQTYTHSFYNSPCPMWDMPREISEHLKEMDLCILKGDANYRRLLGDRKFGMTQPFLSVARWVPSQATLAMRTCKSGILIGADEAAVQAAKEKYGDDRWLTNGEYGIVSFSLNAG